MKALLILLLILLLAAVGIGAFFYGESQQNSKALATLQDENSELKFQVENAQQQVAQLKQRLEEEVAEMSKEKETEIQRMEEAQNKLVQELQGEIEQKQIQITKLADRLTVRMVDKILFPSGEADLTPEGLKVLERVGNIIKSVEDKMIRVEGHTDNVPIHPNLQDKFPTNWELSTTRATNVVRFLQETTGVDPRRLQAVGLAEYYPVASNETVQGRSQNRRIEIALLPMTDINKK